METKHAVNITVPADTRDGLRAQAALLDITGRGAMNKAQLHDAVSREITRRTAQALVDGTDGQLSIKTHDNGTATYTLPADGVPAPFTSVTFSGDSTPAPEVPTVEYISVEIHPTVAAVISAALADTGTRVTGRKGASALLTREYRKDYPATKRTNSKRKGRK